MATAKKLPSGSWRCLVYDYTDVKGKRIYKSFTSDDPTNKGKRQAELEAANYAAKKESIITRTNITFGQALHSYIENRTSVLSPATIREYKRAEKSDFEEIRDRKIVDVTQEQIQELVNSAAKNHSPKTVRNMHGLLSAVFSDYRPEFFVRTELPKKVRPDLYIPSDDDVKKLIMSVKGTIMELPILLAAFGPMRRGEICALDSKNINGNVVHVCQSMAMNDKNKWVIKAPKSYAGDRYIEYPDFVAELWAEKEGRIVMLNPSSISDRFPIILRKNDISAFRFHDLRHYSASIQHAMGIPDAYIMQRGGWSSDTVLKGVYRHALEQEQKKMNDKINNHFSSMQHEMQHETPMHKITII